MKINKVKLKNYRIHEEYEQSFEKGINLLLGNNGSGKSSVLEAIGFALFNSKTRSTGEDIVSKGKTSGSVKVSFVGNDEKEYEIERKFGVGPSINLISLESSQKWSGAKEVYKQVGKILGIDNIDGVFFESVICAKQNQFIEIFMKNPAPRAEHFDELFDAAIYKDLWGKLKEQNEKQYYDEEKTKKERRKTLDEGQENIADLESDLEKYNNELTAEREKQANLEKELINKKKEFEEYNKLKERVGSKEKDVENSKSNIENFTKTRDSDKSYFKASQEARVFLEEKKEDFKKYKSAKEESENLEKERQKFKNASKDYDDLQSQRQKLENKQNKLKADKEIEANNIKIFDEQILKQENEQKEEFGNLEKINSDKKAKEIELKNTKEQIDALSPIYDELEKLAKSKDEKDKEIERLKKAEGELSKKICPTLKERCPLAENNKGYFEKRFKELLAEKNEIEKKMGDASIEEVKSSLKEKQNLLIKQQQEIQNFDDKIKDCNKKINKIKDEIGGLNDKKTDSSKKSAAIDETQKKIAIELQEFEPKIEKTKADKEYAEKLQNEINRIKNEILAGLQEIYDKCLQNKKDADEYEKRESRLKESEDIVLMETKKMEKLGEELKALKANFSEDELKLKMRAVDVLSETSKGVVEKVTSLKKDIEQKNEKIAEYRKTEEKIKNLDAEIDIIRQKLRLTGIFRDNIKDLGVIVVEERVQRTAGIASDYFNKITNRSESILWVCSEKDKYNLYLKGDKEECSFANLSGGEQISVAIAIRLALSHEFGNSGLIILDEPTNNLDYDRRQLLAENLPKMVENLNQLFVVTHDDTFKNTATKVIEFSKER